MEQLFMALTLYPLRPKKGRKQLWLRSSHSFSVNIRNGKRENEGNCGSEMGLSPAALEKRPKYAQMMPEVSKEIIKNAVLIKIVLKDKMLF